MASGDCAMSYSAEMEERKEPYFDATPEPSVCDWEMPRFSDARFFIPALPFGFDDGETGVVANKKTRPPKLVREVQALQACLAETQREIKATSTDVHGALNKKADKFEIAAFSQSLAGKVENAAFEKELRGKVSHKTLQDSLTYKANREEFDELSHRGKALQDGLELISYNMSGKADRASVQAALAQKVSHVDAASTFAQKNSHDALVVRVRSCMALWCLLVVVCIALLSAVIYVLLQQHRQIQKLSDSNFYLSHTVEELNNQNQQLKVGFNQSLPLLTVGNSLEDHLFESEYVSEFHSSQLHEDGYSIELKPPCKNAWVSVEASFRSGHTVCHAKADVILRVDHNIFGLLPASEETKLSESTSTTVALADASKTSQNTSCDTKESGISALGDMNVASTTTSTTIAPCMVIIATMKLKHDGSIVPSLSVKQSSSRLAESNDKYIYDVSGKIQWNRQ